MKPKTMILMVVAVVCGLGASYMTSRLLAERDDKPAEAAEIPKVTLMVAKRSLEMHMPLGKKPEDFFVEKQFVKEDAPKDALTLAEVAKLKGKFLRRALRKGDTITPEDILENNLGLKNLPDGMRAFGVQVNPASIASGWASLPGSHVDIYWTGREVGTGVTVSRLLLEDIIVLAADGADRSPEAGGAMVASVVTLSLSPEDCLKVAGHMSSGSLHLVLRNLNDKSTMKTDIASIKPGKIEPPPPVVEPVPPPAPALVPEKKIPEGYRKFTVTVKNADDVKKYHYWLDPNNNVVRDPDFDSDDAPAPPLPAPEPKKLDKKI
jgi:pilus assembly protein CpaB